MHLEIAEPPGYRLRSVAALLIALLFAAAPAPAAAPLAEAEHVVTIRGMRYEAKHLEVRLGDTVRWLNKDALPNTVTSGPAGRSCVPPWTRRT
jgi:plastocyanin